MGAISVGTALLSGPSRIFSVMTQGMTAVLVAELAFRVILTVTTGLLDVATGRQPFSSSTGCQFKDKGDFSKKVFDFRQLTRDLTTQDLLKNIAIAAIANFIITESIYRTFGAPIEGLNLLGRCIGIQTTTNGILANFPSRGEFLRFWHVMS